MAWFASALLAVPTLTQEPVKPAGRESAALGMPLVSVPAEAIEYGNALFRNAMPELRSWVHTFAKKNVCKRPLDPRGTMQQVDARFARWSDEVRDAITYLVFHVAYLDEEKEQRVVDGKVRRLDEETEQILRQMAVLQGNQQERLAAKRGGITPQEMVRQDEQLRQMDQRLREIAEERRNKRRELASLRKRVDLYYKLFSATHPRMAGVQPEVLQGIK